MPELIIVVVLSVIFFIRQGGNNLNTADEGFLAHGITRIRDGQVPIRDFWAYDPLRYYWCYWFMRVFGGGVLGLRRAAAAFFAIGLWAVLTVVHDAAGSLWPLVPLAVILLWWAYELYKAFEPGVSLMSVAVVSLMIATSTPGTILLSGAWVSFSLLIGINHAAYAGTGTAALLVVMALQPNDFDFVAGIWTWLLGIALGLTPLLLLFLCIKGYWRSYTVRLKAAFTGSFGRLYKQTPMPWHRPIQHELVLPRLSERLLGAHFVVLPFYFAVSVLFLLFSDIRDYPVFAAATFIGAPYLHHAYSRPDLPHLSESIAPFIISVLSFGLYFAPDSEFLIAGSLTFVLCLAILTVSLASPILGPLLYPDHFTHYQIGNDKLLLRKSQVKRLSAITVFLETRLFSSDRVLVAPFEPSFYEILHRLSPIDNDCLYTLYGEAQQNEIVAQLREAGIDAAFINDIALDGLEERRFSVRCPIIWAYLTNEFNQLLVPSEAGEFSRFFVRQKVVQKIEDVGVSELEKCANTSNLKEIKLLRKKFETATPVRQVVIDNFLNEDLAKRLTRAFPVQLDQSQRRDSLDNIQPAIPKVSLGKYGTDYAELDRLLSSQEFLDKVGKITGIQDLKSDPMQYGAGLHALSHGFGQDPHRDFNVHSATGYYCRLKLILFLNNKWNEHWGGTLDLHSNLWDENVSIIPVFNRFVIIETTENGWSSTSPVNLPDEKRQIEQESVTAYLYTKIQPADWIRLRLDREYTSPLLPANITVGRELNVRDMEIIHINLKRRDAYLQQSRKREFHAAQAVSGLQGKVTELAQIRKMPVLGFARVNSVVIPLYSDDWMGPELRFTVKLSRDITKIELIGWRLKEVAATSISMNAGLENVTETVGGGAFSLKLETIFEAEITLDVRVIALETHPGSGVDKRALSAKILAIEFS
jgi:Rps23 Pro-64 3,4-dihydroxylase Tpa1-like proline 4-hydroxylase